MYYLSVAFGIKTADKFVEDNYRMLMISLW